MYKVFYAIVMIVWIIDILNIGFGGHMLDTTYPINGLAWLLIWIFIPAVTNNEKKGD